MDSKRLIIRAFSHCVGVVALTTCLTPLAAGDEPAADTAKLRRPVAVVATADGQRLLTANCRSGTISVVDTSRGRVVHEATVGRRLADLAGIPGGDYLLAVDEAEHQLLLLKRHGDGIAVVQKLAVSRYPVDVCVAADGRHCYVTSLWSRRLSVVDVLRQEEDSLPELRIAATVSLPFAPREQVLVREDCKLIVADSHGGRLAIVDAASGNIGAIRQLPAHNIRGLRLGHEGKKLLISHQILNDLAETTHNDVHWGVLMSNVLRWLDLDAVLDQQREILSNSHVHLTGDSNTAGGDPAEVAITNNGLAVIALGGVNEVGFGHETDYSLERLPVGARPTAIALSPSGDKGYLANTFGDSISVFNLRDRQVSGEISLGPQPKLSQADRGEIAFYDARRSLDGWFSCHSCHTDGHTNDILNDNRSDGSFGTAKRVISLLGVRNTAPWAWNGEINDVRQQIRNSFHKTMQGPQADEETIESVAAYLKTLEPPPAVDAARGELDAKSINRGRQVFTAQGCADCHAPPHYTTPETYDVGIHDKRGNRRFNPPSLLGVSQRDGYFHDNRAGTLDDVLKVHPQPDGLKLSAEKRADLLKFLRSL